mgnify:FL=1
MTKVIVDEESIDNVSDGKINMNNPLCRIKCERCGKKHFACSFTDWGEGKYKYRWEKRCKCGQLILID